jgi:hypothetical protein
MSDEKENKKADRWDRRIYVKPLWRPEFAASSGELQNWADSLTAILILIECYFRIQDTRTG